jgi:arylsulfatase A-like enzyme
LGYPDITPLPPPDQCHDPLNITHLAGQGMTFTNAYANAANCAPSRAALMSGQAYPLQPVYMVNSGARGDAEDRALVPAENETTLPVGKPTIAERLRQAGHATAFMDKWHPGAPPTAGSRQQGFDVNVGGTEMGHPVWDGAYFWPNNNPQITGAEEGEYLTDYIRRHQSNPFYLQLSPYSVHTSMQAPDERVAHYAEKTPVGGHNNPTYAALIESVDRGVGHGRCARAGTATCATTTRGAPPVRSTATSWPPPTE